MQSVLSLSDQLRLFKEYKNKLKAAVGEEKTTTILSKSIYVVCTGSDDIANTYFSTPLRRPHYDVPAYTDLMVKSATTFFQVSYYACFSFLVLTLLARQGFHSSHLASHFIL